ncbi:MAG TPA: energy transducer TonB [Sphingomicrobium sp.]|nr:energy transducer TonB [Sphingomicrobium sp.]
MSYAQRKEISGNRTAAIVIVAILHAILGYAIVTGLAYNVIKKAAEDLKTFDVEEEPPPPEETPPPPPENVPDTPPPVVAPPPIVRTNVTTPPVVAVPVAPPVRITPTAPPAPPAPPPPPRIVPPKSAVGNLQGLFSNDDYPESALEREEQGTVSVSLSIGPNGRVSDCSVASSSGSRTLDSTTCRILKSRARFNPATDQNGQPTSGSFSQRITWRIQ